MIEIDYFCCLISFMVESRFVNISLVNFMISSASSELCLNLLYEIFTSSTITFISLRESERSDITMSIPTRFERCLFLSVFFIIIWWFYELLLKFLELFLGFSELFLSSPKVLLKPSELFPELSALFSDFVHVSFCFFYGFFTSSPFNSSESTVMFMVSYKTDN